MAGVTRRAAGYDYVFAPGDPARAPLVLLHGTGDDAAAFAGLGRRIAPQAPLVSVQGDVDENGMARFFKRRAMGVYDMADLEARTAAMATFLAEVLPAHGLDRDRAVGVGYSNGANLLANLLFRAPAALGRWALLHPLIPFEPPATDLVGRSVLVTAGRRDPISPWPQSERLVADLRARGAEVRLAAHDGGHELMTSELLAVAELAGA